MTRECSALSYGHWEGILGCSEDSRKGYLSKGGHPAQAERCNRREGPIEPHECTRVPLFLTECCTTCELCIAFVSEASRQPPDPKPAAILDANKDPMHVDLPPSIHHSSLFPLFAFSSLPFLILSSMFSRSLSSFNLVIMTLLGAMPIGTLVPFDFSFAIRSMWMTYLRR